MCTYPPHSRLVASVISLFAALILSACAGMMPGDPWLERSAQKNEQIAENWRQAGHPEMGERFATQAAEDRAAQKSKEYGFLEGLFDALFFSWLEKPTPSPVRR